MALEFEERMKLALRRFRDKLKKSTSSSRCCSLLFLTSRAESSLVDESFEWWHSVNEHGGSFEESDAANVTLMSNCATSDDTHKADHDKSDLDAAIYKMPMNTNVRRTAPRLLTRRPSRLRP
jgi:hypothetical protein